MKLTLDIGPDLAAMMAAEIAAGERAVTAAVREAGTGLKLAWRGQITGAGLGTAARELDPVGGVPEGRREPERRGGGLVEGAGDRRRARRRTADPIEERASGWRSRRRPPARRSAGGASRRAAGSGRPGCGSASSIAGRGRACWSRTGRGSTRAGSRRVAVEDRARSGHRADLPAGAAGQAAEAARSRAGRRAGARGGAGVDRGELGGGANSIGGGNAPVC